MIEQMKKLTIVCLSSEQERSLERLRRLASVHVVNCVAPSSAQLDELRREQNALHQAILRMEQETAPAVPEGGAKPTAPEEAGQYCAQLQEAVADEKKAADEETRLVSAIDHLQLWGHFDSRVLDRLQREGWWVALCRLPRNAALETPEEATAFKVAALNGQCGYMVVSRRDLSAAQLPVDSFPAGMDLAALEEQLAQCRRRRNAAAAVIAHIAAVAAAAVRSEMRRLEDDIAFESVRSGMGRAGEKLCYLVGYIPERKLDELREAARANGWAVRYEGVAPDDAAVPTSLALPRPFRMAQTVLDFIGVLPGYREIDVSVSVLLFLIFFCGMLVGDAGYGLLFTAACLGGLWKKHKTPQWGPSADVLRLLLCMSASILLWGSLSGTWFGLHRGGIGWLTDPGNGDNHVKLFCFFIAAVHLSFARIWKAAASSTWREKAGNAGWALFLWANFFTVKALLIDNSFDNFTFPTMLYAAGGTLIVLFSIDWHSFGDIIYSPFNFINSVSDVLSYIRLYAVGLSSLYIARAFNDMAVAIWSGHWLLIPVGLAVLMVGHVLNVALAAMGVLVHGIRLNTLEFSSHIGLEWSGRAYAPFK